MANPASLEGSFKKLRALVFDVDGVLTDGGVWWGPDGQEWKRFCFADIMGVSLARRAGLEIALISGENSTLVDRYAEKLLIKHVAKGCRDKAGALQGFSDATGIALEHICFMGDDVNDLPAMRIAGVSAAPSTGVSEVLSHVDFVAKSPGGNGAVRELIEAVLAASSLRLSDVYAGACEIKEESKQFQARS